ncbi:MAG: isocitrate lyase/PEP mutase family protein [Rhodospirillales bacterium]|jgi:methylisocitrate lyase|nr:isocitrate lyase/PEP mutase family protein [Rhodospirillales bacterium]
MTSLSERLRGPEPVVAPSVFDALTARLAREAGFGALYLGAGPVGYVNGGLEASITLPELARIGLEIRTVCDLPLVLDGTCGWGDPMHVRRTVAMAEAAGFAAIEIEDQILPKRAHHHIGVERMIPPELMVMKLSEVVKARRDPDFLIIGRTHGIRASTMDDALRRAEAYHEAGADMLLLTPRSAEDARRVGERLPHPLMYMARAGGMHAIGLSVAEMGAMGYRLIVDAMTPLLSAYRALRLCYADLARDMTSTDMSADEGARLHAALNETVGLPELLATERATVETE